MSYRRAFKVFHVRRDGTLSPLFVGARERVPRGEWVRARTDLQPPAWISRSRRPGWHAKRELVDALELARYRGKGRRAVFVVALRGNVRERSDGLVLADEMKVLKQVGG